MEHLAQRFLTIAIVKDQQIALMKDESLTGHDAELVQLIPSNPHPVWGGGAEGYFL